MTKKEPTAKQLAARAAASERFKKMHADKKTVEVEQKPDQIAEEQSTDDLKSQVQMLKAQMELMTKMFGGQAPQMNKQGRIVGETEKYSINKDDYPDPTPRLREEPRLNSVNFNYNYELEYGYEVTHYETKTGLNMSEPRFHINLNRIVIDGQGYQTDKRYKARKLTFHEDPDAAITVANENGVDVNNYPGGEKAFLNEMRYLRIRDWLFDVFWPKPADESAKIKEEVIGGQIVQVFTKSSEDASAIDFDSIGGAKLKA